MHFSKRSLSSSLALTVCVTLALGALAQDTKPATDSKPATDNTKRPDAAGADRYEAMRKQQQTRLKELGLTEEQMTKLREINRAQAEKVRALRGDTGLSGEDRRKKMQEIRDATNAEIKGILSPEQFAKFKEFQEQRRVPRIPRGDGRTEADGSKSTPIPEPSGTLKEKAPKSDQ